MIFTGQKISLRKVTLGDCTDTYVQWLADSEVNRYLETRWHEQSLVMIANYVKYMAGSPDNLLLAIIENFTSQHIGNIKIGPINTHHQCADISYFIGSKGHWGNGFATEAITGAVGHAFMTLGMFSLRAGVYGGNLASRKALEKCGFTQRGLFPGELVTENGREDHAYYSLTRHEWEAA